MGFFTFLRFLHSFKLIILFDVVWIISFISFSIIGNNSRVLLLGIIFYSCLLLILWLLYYLVNFFWKLLNEKDLIDYD